MSGYAVNCTHFVICAAVLHTNAPCAVNKITFLHKAYRVFYRATRCEKNNKNYSVCDIGSKNRISDGAAGFWSIKKISALSILQLHICCTPIWCTSSHLSPFWNSIKNEIANSRVPCLKVITSALLFKFVCSPRRCTIQNTPTILGTHKAIRNEYCFLAGKSDLLGRRFALL